MQGTEEQQQVGCLAALLVPLRDLTVPLKKGKTEPLASYITGKSLKRGNDITNSVALLHAELPTLAHLYEQVQGVPAFACAFACACAVRRLSWVRMHVAHVSVTTQCTHIVALASDSDCLACLHLSLHASFNHILRKWASDLFVALQHHLSTLRNKNESTMQR